MRKLIFPVALVLATIAIYQFPAALLLPRLGLPDQMTEVRGTAFFGHARWRQPGHAPLFVQWQHTPWLVWRWQVAEGMTNVVGQWRPRQARELLAVEGRIELERLDLGYWFENTRPLGHIALDLARVSRGDDGVPSIHGQAVWEEARLEGAIHESLGRVGLDFEPGPERQRVRLRSLDPGALLIRGEILIDADHYEVDLWLRASPDRPDLGYQLTLIGQPQPDGQVRIQATGQTGLR